jgi:hypothetical protein
MKGETMRIHACFVTLLLGAATGAAADPQPREPPDVPVVADRVLEDVGRLRVVLATQDAEGIAQVVDLAKLKTRIVEKLDTGGIQHVESQTAPGPKLVVHVEGLPVPEGGSHVWRIQTVLSRTVTLSSRKDVQVEAPVWQVKPAMEVVARTETEKMVPATVLAQVEAFVGACTAARRAALVVKDGKPAGSAAGSLTPTPAGTQEAPNAAGYAFVSSKSSSVFHRPDCRWAQNISGSNLVGYKTREEAVQAGKRPCKTCQP